VVNGLLVKLYPGQEARALAIAAIGISVAVTIMPLLVGSLLAQFDWRQTLQILATGLLVVLWLVILAGIPGGVVHTASTVTGPASAALYRNPTFWLIGLCVAMVLNVSVVVGVSYPPHFASQGYTVADAGRFLAVSGMAGLVGKSCFAWLGDAARNYAKWIAAALLLLQIAGLGLLFVAEGASDVMRALCLVGFGIGAFVPMHPYLNSRYFDAGIISQVNGAQGPLFLPFGLVGAPLAGFVFDRTGSYDMVFIALVATLAVAALLIVRLPKATN
jgi:cyanate permease